jgi:iron(III) transport system ATP-binding protein
VAGRQAWARQSLARIGLADYADSYPHTLSGGQQQRCALLRALAPEPEVLLLDEPFSGLDVTLRAQVREETANLLRETGVATLAVTHDPEEAMFISDRLLVMNDGRILQQGTPEEIYLHPADPFVAGLFGPVNRLEGVVTAGRVDTPFGSLAVSGVIDGVRAVVLIRPEGISIGRSDPGASARVTGARMLGRSSHLRLVLEGVGTALEALVPGVVLPGEGTPVTLTLDTRLAFVFPAG